MVSEKKSKKSFFWGDTNKTTLCCSICPLDISEFVVRIGGIHMKSVIYYFTGTGNSQNTARIIAKEIGGAELISVKQDAKNAPATDADMIGFICPIYEWDIPTPMEKFIKELEINPNAYIFSVVTYIAIHGRCFETIEEILKSKGTYLHYAKAIRCVASQCIAYAPFPPEKIMTPYSRRKAVSVGKKIAQKKQNKYPKMSRVTRRLYSKMMMPFINIQHEYDKGFYPSEDCIGCGICQKVCPCHNITMDDKHPVFNHQCIGCNACVVYCPKKAIKFRTPEAYRKLDNIITRKLKLPDKRKRYHHPNITAQDLMKDREVIE